MPLAAALLMIQLQPQTDALLKEREDILRTTIEKEYRVPGSKFYRELVKDGKPGKDVAFLWCHAVQMSAVARGLKVDRATYEPLWLNLRDGLDGYWTSKGVGGYAVWPGQEKEPDRYYDDNAWIVWAALDAYEVTKDPEDMKRAIRAYDFAVDGLDDKLGGGIYWREREKKSKNACINTPIAATAYMLYRITDDIKYWRMGESLVAWTKKHLQDKDRLIMDNISIDGKVDKTKWSYNTACYIRALIERERIQPDLVNRAEITLTLEAALKHWYKDSSLLMKGPGMFGQHLIDAMLEAAEVLGRKELVAQATNSILKIASYCANDKGLYGENWDRKPNPSEELKLHFIGSVLRGVLSARAAQ